MLLQQPTKHTLACMEVWGGNHQITREVELPDLMAWVYSKPSGSADGGDVHYFSVCGEAVISRVVLADVSGHGAEVSTAAQRLYELMQENINTWDQSDFVRRLNASFSGAASGGHYATAVVLGFRRDTGELVFTNAAHPSPLVYRSGARSWHWLYGLDDAACTERERAGVGEGLPVGLIPSTEYCQSVTLLEPSDMLLLYSDGISEAENEAGEMLGPDHLKQWLTSAPTDSPSATGQFLLSRLRAFRKEFVTDDETIIAIKRGSKL
jgi:phosphoserine phosphatase RsbU/P